jgi:hypothetical protein
LDETQVPISLTSYLLIRERNDSIIVDYFQGQLRKLTFNSEIRHHEGRRIVDFRVCLQKKLDCTDGGDLAKDNQDSGFPVYKGLLLCIYAFLVVFKPSEPFLVLFFVNEKNVTKTQVIYHIIAINPIIIIQVYEDIFPIWTYSYFLCLLTEYIGYKFSILLGILGNIITIIILLLTNDFFLLQLEQVTIGMASASFIILSSFLYNAVPSIYYQKITSLMKSCYLIGTVTSAMLGQLLLKYTNVTLMALFYISLISIIFAGNGKSLVLSDRILGITLAVFPTKKKEQRDTVSRWKKFRDLLGDIKSNYTYWNGVFGVELLLPSTI